MIKPTDAQRKQWEEEGYLELRAALTGEQLQRLQEAFDYWAEACKAEWLDKLEAGQEAASYYDIPDVLKRDPIFIDLVDHPSYFGIVQEFMQGPMLVLDVQARSVPAWPVSYSSWHSDVPLTNPLHMKVQVYVNDVDRGCGEFGYVPGSHRPDRGPYPKVQRLESMPGYRSFPGRAGDAIMFSSYGLHSAMDNHSDQARKSVIIIYELKTPGRLDPDTHSAIRRYCTNAGRRSLFNLEA
jgi:hypothetical protein